MFHLLLVDFLFGPLELGGVLIPAGDKVFDCLYQHFDAGTIWRWVQRYAPEMERRLRSRLKPTNDSWRLDETYLRAKRMFEKFWQIKTHGQGARVCPSCLEAGMGKT